MKKSIVVFFCFIAIHATAQIGGNGIYQVLNVAPSARIAAMGGTYITPYDRDVNIGFQNPAMINRQMDRQLSINYLNYFTDINQGYFAYARHFDSVGTFAAGIQYLNYGTFKGADIAGNSTGTFTASDMALQIGYGNNKKQWRYGANMKVVYSQLETYKSLGVAFDIAGAYVSKDTLFTATVVARNAGLQIMQYVPGNAEHLPFEVMIGVSQKLRHAPFRLSMVAHNLQKGDISYINPNAKNLQIDFATQKPIQEKVSTGDKIMRHLIFGVEAVFSKNFNIRFAYNHQRRKEMSLPDMRGFTGFSWGFSLKLLKMNVSYGNAGFFPKTGSHHFSLLIDTPTFFKRKKKAPSTTTPSI
ncbi:MAG: type IX secretion system protein PorQ [Bacteroidetes bacterium]|nr:MAG: type IX secretion system protein PorQ [Bacteroidota bacterium]